MEEKLREYAKLLIEVGLNVQPGQTLVISSPVDCAPFARLCASAAYDVGCREVVMRWSDDYLNRERFLRADDSVFDSLPLGQKDRLSLFAIGDGGVRWHTTFPHCLDSKLITRLRHSLASVSILLPDSAASRGTS